MLEGIASMRSNLSDKSPLLFGLPLKIGVPAMKSFIAIDWPISSSMRVVVEGFALCSSEQANIVDSSDRSDEWKGLATRPDGLLLLGRSRAVVVERSHLYGLWKSKLPADGLVNDPGDACGF